MPYRVLMVDDDPNVLAGLRRSLRQENYEVLTAEGSAEALAILQKSTVDLIVTDEGMPGMTGTELLARVRELHPDTLRILLTGKGSFEVAMEAVNQGEVFRLFAKPCNPVELALAIRQALKQKELMLESRRLLKTVRRQRLALEELEHETQGIGRVVRDRSGAIVLDDVPLDLDALLKEAQEELSLAEETLPKDPPKRPHQA